MCNKGNPFTTQQLKILTKFLDPAASPRKLSKTTVDAFVNDT